MRLDDMFYSDRLVVFARCLRALGLGDIVDVGFSQCAPSWCWLLDRNVVSRLFNGP